MGSQLFPHPSAHGVAPFFKIPELVEAGASGGKKDHPLAMAVSVGLAGGLFKGLLHGSAESVGHVRKGAKKPEI
jgi:hypothetical protein